MRKKLSHVKGGKRSHVDVKCSWKGKVLLNHVRASKRKGR